MIRTVLLLMLFSGAVLLTLSEACETHGTLLKCRFWFQWVWGGDWGSPFLRRLPVLLVVLESDHTLSNRVLEHKELFIKIDPYITYDYIKLHKILKTPFPICLKTDIIGLYFLKVFYVLCHNSDIFSRWLMSFF